MRSSIVQLAYELLPEHPRIRRVLRTVRQAYHLTKLPWHVLESVIRTGSAKQIASLKHRLRARFDRGSIAGRRERITWTPLEAIWKTARNATLLATPDISRTVLDDLRKLAETAPFTGRLVTDVLDMSVWGTGVPGLSPYKLRENYTNIAIEARLFEESAAFRPWLAEQLDTVRYRGLPLVELAHILIAERDVFYRRLQEALPPLLAKPEILVLPTPAYTDPASWLRILHLFADNGTHAIRFIEGHRFRRYFPPVERAAFPVAPDEPARQLAQRIVQEARHAATGANPVLICAGGSPGSIFWAAMEKLAAACQQAGIPVLVLTHGERGLSACRAKAIPAVHVAPHPFAIADHRAALETWLGRVDRLHEAVRDSDRDPASLALITEIRRSTACTGWIRHEMAVVDVLVALFEALEPRSIALVPHWSQLGNSVNQVAKLFGVPRITFPLVTVAGNAASIVDWDADLICAYGTQCVDAFVAMGHARDQLVITGNPGLDDLLRLERAAARGELRAHGVTQTRPRMVLIATSRADTNEAIWIKPLARFCATRGDTQLVVKVHPSFNREEYDQIASDADAYTVATSGSIWNYIKAADICITDFSTVGAEAVIAGVPLIVVNLTGDRFVCNNYDEYGVASFADSADALLQQVGALLDGADRRGCAEEQREAFLAAYNHGNDGKASSRVAAILAEPNRWLMQRAENPAAAVSTTR